MISFENILSEKFGSTIISIILGLGLASLFKRVCKNDCIIYRVQNYNQIKNNVYKWDENCYKYEKVDVDCSREKKNYIKEEEEKDK